MTLTGEAAKQAEKARASRATDGSMFSLKDLDWFSSNAYVCAVKGCETWETQQITSIAGSCLKVLPLLTNRSQRLTVVPHVVPHRHGH